MRDERFYRALERINALDLPVAVYDPDGAPRCPICGGAERHEHTTEQLEAFLAERERTMH